MKSFLYLLCLSLLLSSCELFQSPSPSMAEEDTLSSPFLLSQIDYLYDTPIMQHQFFYNEQSRLVKSISNGYIHSLYEYNAKNQIEKVHTFYTSRQGDTMQHYYDKQYTYNNQGKWIKCVFSGRDTVAYATMSYEPNKEIVHHYFPDENTLIGKITYEYSNGNLIKRKREDFDTPAVEVTTYEYSDINNPLVYLDKILEYQCNGADRYNDHSTPHSQSKKLLTKITRTNTRSDSNRSIEYFYEFDSNGIPTKITSNTDNDFVYANTKGYTYIKR